MINSFKLSALKKIENKHIKVITNNSNYLIQIDFKNILHLDLSENEIKKLTNNFTIVSIKKIFDILVITLK